MNPKLKISKRAIQVFIVLALMLPLLAPSGGYVNPTEKQLEKLTSEDLVKTEPELTMDEPNSLTDPDKIGMYSRTQKTWYLKGGNIDGWADVSTVRFGSTDSSWIPVAGDWNGSGKDTIAMYSRTQKTWYLKDANIDGWGGITTVRFGSTDSSWIPVAGDWNGNGTDTIGMYSRTQKTWYLKGSNTDGWGDVSTVSFGSTDSSWIPVAGDWNNNGTDTIGMYSRTQKTWYLKGSNTDGWGGITTVRFGSTDSSWIPMVGDWNGNGTDTIGMYSRTQKTWYLKGGNIDGWADVSTVRFGSTSTSWIPVVGDWASASVPGCYTLTRNFSPPGSGSAPTASPTNSSGCPSGQYTSGQSIQVTPHPGTGWAWDYWTGTSSIGIETPVFLMPSSNHTVTAYHKRTPTTLRIYNDLAHAGGWDFYNGLIWIRTAANCSDYNMAGHTPEGGTEYLWPLDFTYNILDREWLLPVYRSTSSYIDIDVSAIPLASDGSYCVLIEAGWWDTEFDPFGGPTIYRKKPSNCLCCNGAAGCAKWAQIQIIEPYGDPEVIYTHDWLPDYGTWQGHPICGP